MGGERIEVVAYSGYRGEERPRVILRNGERIEVLVVLGVWTEERVGDRATKRWFSVKGSDGSVHKIFYDEKVKEWFYQEG
jgi:hypothetical protein